MWKRSCKEIKNETQNREKLEAILRANLPSNEDRDKVENQIDDINDFIESRMIELRILSKKRSRQKFSRKFFK